MMWIFLAVLTCGITFTLCDETLVFSAVIYRHGDRTPIDPYPTDPWRNESLWPVKFGQLTATGVKQHYALGKWLRKRYSKLISERFDPAEVYIRATDVDRTLMSAEANLAGLYPPVGGAVWNEDLLWQPIPVHTVKEQHDVTLSRARNCKAYNEEKKKLMNSQSYKERLSKYQELMDYLTAYTGSKIKDYTGIEYIYNTLYIESLYNFTLPDWTRKVYPDEMLEPTGISFTLGTATPLLARLRVGPLFTEILSHMNASTYRAGSDQSYKLVVYSAHDDNIGDVLNALGVFNGHCPPYTSTILMELFYDNTSSSHFVQISYRNSTEIVEPHILRIPYCGLKCPLERFRKLYQNLLITDWQRECSKEVPGFLMGALFFGVGIIMMVYIGHKLYFAKIVNQYRFREPDSSAIRTPLVKTPIINTDVQFQPK